jgi:NAD(P)-dependent dehydrogenase (short-subunit alcohol dehydrogenase family)
VKAVVVTGVSSGIGEATAKLLAARGFRVYGSVRKLEDGERLKQEIGANFEPLVFDVIDESAVKAAAEKVRADLEGQTLFGLVNNAGISVPGPALMVPVEKWRRQLEVNIIGPVIAMQAFAPLLGTDLSRQGEPGKIVNISSVAGKRAFPFQGPYAASKHGLEAVSEALRRELMLYGIDVVIIGPGPIRTAIWAKGAKADFSAYEGTPYLAPLQKLRYTMQAGGMKGLPPEAVAERIHDTLISARVSPRYTITPGKFKRWLLSKLPLRVFDRIIAKQIGLKNVRKN